MEAVRVGGRWLKWWGVGRMVNNALAPRHIPATPVSFPHGRWNLALVSGEASVHIFLLEASLEAS